MIFNPRGLVGRTNFHSAHLKIASYPENNYFFHAIKIESLIKLLKNELNKQAI